MRVVRKHVLILLELLHLTADSSKGCLEFGLVAFLRQVK